MKKRKRTRAARIKRAKERLEAAYAATMAFSQYDSRYDDAVKEMDAAARELARAEGKG